MIRTVALPLQHASRYHAPMQNLAVLRVISDGNPGRSRIDHCKYTSEEAGAAIALEHANRKELSPYRCLHCKATFKSLWRLRPHVQYVHDLFEPRTCQLCDNGKVHRNRSTWEGHLYVSHSTPWEPTKCPFTSSCGNHTIYSMHLRSIAIFTRSIPNYHQRSEAR